MLNVLVVGAGGFGRAVAEAAVAAGQHALVGFIDDRWPALRPIWDIPILGRLADLHSLQTHANAAVVSIGDNLTRSAAVECLTAAGFELVNVIHPRAIVSPSARIGKGVIVMAGAIIGTESRLDDGAIVNCGAVLDHHCHVGRFARLSVGACMGGGAVLGPGAWLKEGCILSSGQKIGAGEIIDRSNPEGT